MSLIYQVVKRIEISKITEKVRYFLTKHPSHSILIALGLLLVYAIYGALTLQTIMNMDLDLSIVYINFIKISLVLSIFFVIIFRNGFKANDFVFFYLNSKIKAHQIILSRIFLPFVFYFIILILAALPIMVSIIIKGFTVNLLYLLLLLITSTIIYFFSFTLWMAVNIITMKIMTVKEKFFLNTFINVLLVVGLIFLINPLSELIGDRKILHSTIILLFGILVTYFFVHLSLEFLNKTFMQKDAGTLSQKYTSKKLDYENKFLLQSKLEIIHFFRNQVFKEQSFFFITLIVLIISLYHSLDLANFSMMYSMIINFGLKEIILLLPLTIGIHFREYLQAIYTLNVGKYQYFLSRLFIIYSLNCLTYFLFIAISYFLTGMEVFGILETFIIIGFVTILSTMVGFVIKINELNKIYVIILLLIIVNVFDMFIRQLIVNQVLVQFTYISLAVIMFFIVETFYLRRPIVK
ncbi:hypothetical protein ACFSTA_17600 [Ornithinibacillus salinisoli]|uniref:Permease n=1 Tax=Ornithinibacillus salinisoli TaxID=1848459 RepID=A0ABW4W1U8_9BACI